VVYGVFTTICEAWVACPFCSVSRSLTNQPLCTMQEVPPFLLEPSYMERNENEGYYMKVVLALAYRIFRSKKTQQNVVFIEYNHIP
jgi:hypothetical protein